MRKNKKILIGMLAVLTFTLCFLPTRAARADEAKKEKTYTVTFRAGDVGTFNTKAVSESDSVEVTENYVKFTVKKGESLPFESDEELYAYLKTLTSDVVGEDGKTTKYIRENYRLRPIADWAEGAATKEIRKNTEYVLDYVRLVHRAMYKNFTQ